MAHTDAVLRIDPEIIRKLSSEKAGLWTAAHYDGSKNRMDSDAVMDAFTFSVEVGLLETAFQWIKKKFKNRGKSKAELAAEKEASMINMASARLEQLLLEYLKTAQEGSIDETLLDDLTGTLEEMDGWYKAGKLVVPGKKDLTMIRKSITGFTAAIMENNPETSVPETDTSGTDEFRLIKDQLLSQKTFISGVPDPQNEKEAHL